MVGSGKQSYFDDCGRPRFSLTTSLLALESISPYIFMHMKNVQIGGRTCPLRQFEGKVVFDPEIDLKLDSANLIWIISPH
jgi:hypothetical protein